jgi:hypothetical protein
LANEKLVAIKLKFVQQNIFSEVNKVGIFSAAGGLGFATFFWKVAKKINPNNPVNPV